jgi:peptidoglycan/LPS O-acetylase OafA/YrhL
MQLRQTRPMAAKKYPTLDGLRGIAAMAVVLYHMPQPLHRAASGGYLAVDLFFLMSGFVIAAAYEQRLAHGWSAREFMIVRLKRLWPLYALGVAVGAACFAAVRDLRPSEAFAFPHMPMAEAIVLSVLFVPQLIAYGGPAFPFNSASWSLSVELFGNLGYGAVARFLSTRTLVAATAIGLAGLVVVALNARSLDVGVSAGHVLPGYVRFLFSFPLGLLLYRLHAAGKLPEISLPAWLPLSLTALALVGFGHVSAVRDVLIVAFVFPAVLVASLSRSVPMRMTGILAWAGAVSYPLYILHPPLVELIAGLSSGSAAPGVLLVCTVAIVLLAAAAERWFDRPIQNWFKRAARPRPMPASLGS